MTSFKFVKNLLAAFILACLTMFYIVTGARAQGPGMEELAKKGEQQLHRWRIPEASLTADKAVKLSESGDQKALAYYLKSLVKFYKGNYKEAKQYAKMATSTPGLGQESLSFLNYVMKVSETGMKFKEAKTEHFTIRYFHPKDSVLIDYAEQALEKAYYEIGLDLEAYPKERTVVEIYPDIESFTLASTLPVENIKTTGVVGVCKFNRIMILSPRHLPKGYTWLDTLAHEYTHLLVFLKSENRVPVWMHEGIAKFLEERWRSKSTKVLTPFYETLLAEALKEEKLVPIEKMHPSFGKLNSAREAQLAFAQAGTTVSFLADRWGEGSLVKLLTAFKQVDSYEAAIKKVTGMEFDEFYKSWEEYLELKNLQVRIPQLKVKEIELSSEGKTPESEDRSAELADIDDRSAREYARLGDMLSDKGRPKAASYEYEKALKSDPLSPVITNRLASSQIEYGELSTAKDKLLRLLDYYPDYIDTYLNLAEIYVKRGNLREAKNMYETAIAINPFDPEIHSNLASIYMKLVQTELADREKEVLSILMRENGK